MNTTNVSKVQGGSNVLRAAEIRSRRFLRRIAINRSDQDQLSVFFSFFFAFLRRCFSTDLPQFFVSRLNNLSLRAIRVVGDFTTHRLVKLS